MSLNVENEGSKSAGRGLITSRSRNMNKSTTFKRYGVKEYIRGWHIIDSAGEIVWDGAGYGEDRPLKFHNEDEALACAARMSDAMEENQ